MKIFSIHDNNVAEGRAGVRVAVAAKNHKQAAKIAFGYVAKLRKRGSWLYHAYSEAVWVAKLTKPKKAGIVWAGKVKCFDANLNKMTPEEAELKFCGE